MAQLNQRFRDETNGGAVLFLRPESSGFMVNNGLRSRSWRPDCYGDANIRGGRSGVAIAVSWRKRDPRREPPRMPAYADSGAQPTSRFRPGDDAEHKQVQTLSSKGGPGIPGGLNVNVI